MGGGLGEVERGLTAVVDGTGGSRWRCTSATRRAQPVGDDVLARAADRAGHPQPVQRVDRRPDAAPRRVGHVFGSPVTVPVPDLDRTDYLLILGRQPVRVERQPVHRARLPRPHRGDQGAGRQGRGRRPAALAHGRGGRRVGPGPAGSDALLLAAICNVLVAEGLADPGEHSRHTSPGWTGSVRRSRRSPRGRRRRDRCRRRAHPPARPRAAAAPTAAVYGRIGTTTTEFGSTASWLVDAVEHPHRQPRPRRRVDVRHPGGRWPDTRGKPGAGRGFTSAAATRVSGRPR